jgi:hypothetical protein
MVYITYEEGEQLNFFKLYGLYETTYRLKRDFLNI